MFDGKKIFWLPLNKHAMNIWLSSLRIRAHLSWRTGKNLHVLHVLWTYSRIPGYHNLCSPAVNKSQLWYSITRSLPMSSSLLSLSINNRNSFLWSFVQKVTCVYTYSSCAVLSDDFFMTFSIKWDGGVWSEIRIFFNCFFRKTIYNHYLTVKACFAQSLGCILFI